MVAGPEIRHCPQLTLYTDAFPLNSAAQNRQRDQLVVGSVVTDRAAG